MKAMAVGMLLGVSGAALAQGAKSTSKAAPQSAPKPYRAMPGFKNVANYAAVKKKSQFTPAQEKLLSQNLIMARPSDFQQLFHVYESNDYQNMPSLVTTDTVLQLYHIFFDFTLRTAETEAFLPALQTLTKGMLRESTAQWKAASDEKLKSAALKNVAYFTVADRLLGLSDESPEEALKLARVEMDLIAKHEGFAQGAIFPYKFDYSQFIPRGHYTRSQSLRRYFGAMMWYGLVPFATREGGKLQPETIRQGLLWTRALQDAKLGASWQAIYNPTAFYVGTADDLTPEEFMGAAREFYGTNAPLLDYADDAKLARFADAVDVIRAPRIAAQFGLKQGVPAGTPNMITGPLPDEIQLRFMGQRYIPDSEILQRLSAPGQRVFPSGLDVMSVMGNNRATQILDAYPQIYNANGWAGYKAERAKLNKQFAALPRTEWTSNLYYGWLDALRALQEPAASNHPSFMRGIAWQDKSLNTALASWAQLRHDTILYGKQSVVQCGGDEAEPPFVKGYVEPNVKFYERLIALTKLSRSGLQSRKLLPEKLTQKFEDFEDLLTFLKRVSEKELRGQKLTRDEYLDIRYIGGKLEYMTVSVIGENGATWELLSETEKDMAVVADVHTGGDKVLEQGVGRALELYAIVPIEGKLYLARGAAFSYYEFKHPASDRLTDEKWQALLKAGKTPAPPIWTKSFLAPGKGRKPTPVELEGYNSGC